MSFIALSNLTKLLQVIDKNINELIILKCDAYDC